MKLITSWLYTGCLLIFLMVMVGGITRMTGSGLSIVEWKIVTGTIPPLNESQWQKEFDQYKTSPQFRQQNFSFTLNDFKKIYWWEYIHRLLGRIIGIVFIVPFIYFLKKKMISKELMPKLLIIFFLGALQGIIGWYMVKSGLVDNPRVSHYRLALHLVTALITFGYTFWVALSTSPPTPLQRREEVKSYIHKFLLITLSILIFLQITYGAFTAGLKAGHIYNTFPKMNDEWVAASVSAAWNNDGIKSLTENPATVQFIHRCMAYLVFCTALFLWLRRGKLKSAYTKTLHWLMPAITVQALLGILTLIYNVPLLLGTLHQVGAFFIVSLLIVMIHNARIIARL